MNRAIFLDRDGVLLNNEHHYYIWKSEQLEFVPGVFDNLRRLQQKGYKLFIVSNQGGISRGLYSKNDIVHLHERLIQIFSEHQITITDVLFCPHHPDNEKCLCRKPESLMLEKLIAKYKLSPTDCVMIGDSESDMQAADLAHVKGIKIVPNTNMFCSIANILS